MNHTESLFRNTSPLVNLLTLRLTQRQWYKKSSNPCTSTSKYITKFNSMVAVVLLIIMRFWEKKRQNRYTVPRSSSYVPENVPQRAPAARSPAAPGSGSPWFRSPHTPSWTCSSTESLTYSNIHSVTRGHRGKETEGTACFRQVTEKKKTESVTSSQTGEERKR